MSAEIIPFPRSTRPVDANGLCTKAAACPCDDPCSFAAKMLGPVPPPNRRPPRARPPLIFGVPLFPAVPDDPDDAPAA
jgi:hypothetical protein